MIDNDKSDSASVKSGSGRSDMPRVGKTPKKIALDKISNSDSDSLLSLGKATVVATSKDSGSLNTKEKPLSDTKARIPISKSNTTLESKQANKDVSSTSEAKVKSIAPTKDSSLSELAPKSSQPKIGSLAESKSTEDLKRKRDVLGGPSDAPAPRGRPPLNRDDVGRVTRGTTESVKVKDPSAPGVKETKRKLVTTTVKPEVDDGGENKKSVCAPDKYDSEKDERQSKRVSLACFFGQ